MTIILNGTTGVTFPDGTTQTDGIATPVPVADGGTGSATAADARTALSAAKSGANSDITSITGLTTALSVAQGGTGATTLTANNVLLGNGTSALQAVAPGSNGNVLTSNGTTWVSSAPSGGVTSLNGQTGAITNTDYGAIGSYLACLTRTGWSHTNSVQSAPGTTLAGSGLYGLTGSGYGSGLALQDGDGSFKFNQIAGSSQQSSLGLSGTWRVLTFFRPAIDIDSTAGVPMLLVRVS